MDTDSIEQVIQGRARAPSLNPADDVDAWRADSTGVHHPDSATPEEFARAVDRLGGAGSWTAVAALRLLERAERAEANTQALVAAHKEQVERLLERAETAEESVRVGEHNILVLCAMLKEVRKERDEATARVEKVEASESLPEDAKREAKTLRNTLIQTENALMALRDQVRLEARAARLSRHLAAAEAELESTKREAAARAAAIGLGDLHDDQA